MVSGSSVESAGHRQAAVADAAPIEVAYDALQEYVLCMRTTVDLPDPLLRRARRFMKARGMTLRELLERGLREVLDNEAPEVGFELTDAAFSGEQGFAPGAAAGDVPSAIRRMNETGFER